jgi:hypothetical protein
MPQALNERHKKVHRAQSTGKSSNIGQTTARRTIRTKFSTAESEQSGIESDQRSVVATSP